MKKFFSWFMQKKDKILDDTIDTTLAKAEAAEETEDDGNDNEERETVEEEEEIEIEEEAFAGVLVNDDVPTITRQLNFLANIVKRALLFGGDQELLVLSENLKANRDPFIRRWYPNTPDIADPKNEIQPGVEYFNCLVQLLKDYYEYGVIANI